MCKKCYEVIEELGKVAPESVYGEDNEFPRKVVHAACVYALDKLAEKMVQTIAGTVQMSPTDLERTKLLMSLSMKEEFLSVVEGFAAPVAYWLGRDELTPTFDGVRKLIQDQEAREQSGHGSLVESMEDFLRRIMPNADVHVMHLGSDDFPSVPDDKDEDVPLSDIWKNW